jgi:hypothetical protein
MENKYEFRIYPKEKCFGCESVKINKFCGMNKFYCNAIVPCDGIKRF